MCCSNFPHASFASHGPRKLGNQLWECVEHHTCYYKCAQSRTISHIDNMHEDATTVFMQLRRTRGSHNLPRIKARAATRASNGLCTEQAQDARLRPPWRRAANLTHRRRAATRALSGHECASRARALRAQRTLPWPRSALRAHHHY